MKILLILGLFAMIALAYSQEYVIATPHGVTHGHNIRNNIPHGGYGDYGYGGGYGGYGGLGAYGGYGGLGAYGGYGGYGGYY